MYVIMQV